MLILVYLDYRQDMKINKEEFVALAGRIVSESDELNTKGDEVAEACTEKTLKKVISLI